MIRAAAAMFRADTILVPSLADGMNLTAKDAVVINGRDAAAVITETCGVHHELGDDAISIRNPRDVREISGAMYQASRMPLGKRRHHMRRMKTQVEGHPITRWSGAQTADIHAVIAARHAAGPSARVVAM
jgi:trehalose-6-phosphate synthase